MNPAESWVNYISHVASIKDREYLRYAIERVQQDAREIPAGFRRCSIPLPEGIGILELMALLRRALVVEPADKSETPKPEAQND